jgi:hypothetical protein
MYTLYSILKIEISTVYAKKNVSYFQVFCFGGFKKLLATQKSQVVFESIKSPS